MPTIIDEPVLTAETEAHAPAALPRPLHGPPRRVGLKQRALGGMAALCQACCGCRERQALGILMYHRIADPPPGRPQPTWNVPPKLLEAQLRGLLSRGWQALPLRQVLDCAARELPIPRKAFVVTFDDGYANNLIHAAPILARLHVPATVFLATAYLDSQQPFPSDDWSAAGVPGVPRESWRPLTTDEARRLAASGLVELAAHTHTHADFRGRPDDFLADLEENLEILRERFGVQQPAFAFPYGTKCDGFAAPELAQAARAAGVSCVLTSEPELIRRGDNPYDWGRFAAEDFDTAATLAGKLGGWHSALRRVGKGTWSGRPRATGGAAE